LNEILPRKIGGANEVMNITILEISHPMGPLSQIALLAIHENGLLRRRSHDALLEQAELRPERGHGSSSKIDEIYGNGTVHISCNDISILFSSPLSIVMTYSP
jgi:hypothetical protein